MKKLKTLIMIPVFVVIAVIALAVVGLIYSDSLIKVGVETAGTQATGTNTTLKGANLSVMNGELSLSGLKIANPPGYQTGELVDIGKCTTAVDIQSLMSDTVVVKVVRIENLSMTIEQKGLNSNLGDILDQIKKLQSPSEKAPPTAEKKPGKKVKVDLIELKDPVVRLKLLPIPGQTDVTELKLGTIKLENVTPDSKNPEMVATIFQKVLVALSEAVVKAGGQSLPGDLQKGLSQSVQSAGQLFGNVTKQISDQTGQILKGSSKTVEEATKGVGDVLKLPGRLVKPADKK
jgi:hypothetical protein